MYNAFQSVLNIILAIILGLIVDVLTNSFLAQYGILRVFTHIVIIVAVVFGTNYVYRTIEGTDVVDGLFFVSVFLGMQSSLWQQIHNSVK